MSKDITGGCAFPNERFYSPGMTLRDWFAGKALHLAMPCNASTAEQKNIDIAAAFAYRIADAMLEARQK